MPKRVDPDQRRGAVARLEQLRSSGTLTSEHVRLAASGLGVDERTVWRWISPDGPGVSAAEDPR